MKSLRVFLCLFAVGALMTACQKESIENSSDVTEKRQFDVDEYMDAYLVKHGAVKIEYLSLEELNKVLNENGVNPVTLVELGLSQEEYEEGQNRINNSSPTFGSRCSAANIIGMGDINSSGTTTVTDCLVARQVILGIVPPSLESQAFGEISLEVANFGPNLSSIDVNMLYLFILGQLPSCN